MAEAVVDGTPMSRFFCHKCSVEIERLLPDYTCPQCASGFIEELENDDSDRSSGMETDYGNNMGPFESSVNQYNDILDWIEMYTTTRFPEGNSQTGTSQGGVFRRVGSPTRNRTMQHEALRVALENFIPELIVNLSGIGPRQPASQDGEPPVSNVRVFLRNPGDYIWGRDGLDAIVTQLLNQMDTTGPPPLPKNQIDEIPTINVSQIQIDSKLKCSVCWEDFILSEPVRQLPCQHLYHAPCIVPWLELHGTCPICRQSLGDQNSTETNQDTVGSSLAALFSQRN
ncbi:E3 ubiquitin-protein ligase RNF115 isoform X3 [Prorops nasuta]|uniref:E3 ubiquitin-protein ligase RNF115 isoform X3 n=1 Tax=Prorops nasuta TaxID=863751 RepID=UPI0034CF2150